MRSPVPSLQQVKTDPPSENRVVGSSPSLAACAWSYGSEPVELRQEIGSMGTATVSGVLYWLSKDPIGISGGLNAYEFCYNNPINYFDPDGQRPYVDKYNTPKEAAGQALQDINPTSIAQNREFGGMVYQNSDGTYSYNAPWRGGSDWVICNIRPFFRKKVADYHTHGYDPPDSDIGEDFSPEDIGGRRLHFLGTPDSWIRQYDPSTGTGIIVGRTPRPKTCK